MLIGKVKNLTPVILSNQVSYLNKLFIKIFICFVIIFFDVRPRFSEMLFKLIDKKTIKIY
jgi:hypothetical protein